MGLLKGKVLTPKFLTAQITTSEDRIYFVPIKHTINDYFLCEIEGQFFAFDLHGARKLTHRTKSGIGKSFQIVQYDTSHYSSLNPSTKELELMLQANGLPKVDRRLHNILSILARREKKNFGKWSVGEEDFDTKVLAENYLAGLNEKFYIKKDKNDVETKVPFDIIHNVHNMKDLYAIFEKEEGEFPNQVKEITAYLKGLDVKQIVTPLRKITDFITDDLISTKPSFLGESVARYQRLDGSLRNITNVPVKPSGNIMKYMIVMLVVGIGIAAVYGLSESGALDGLFEFTDNLGTIQDGFKDSGLGSIGGGFTTMPTGGAANSDASIMSKYPDCESLELAINDGVVDYNNLSSDMKTLVDTC